LVAYRILNAPIVTFETGCTTGYDGPFIPVFHQFGATVVGGQHTRKTLEDIPDLLSRLFIGIFIHVSSFPHDHQPEKEYSLCNPKQYRTVTPSFDLPQPFQVFLTMDFENKFYLILLLLVLTLLINLPFGSARAKTKRYSFRWFLYIHVPIPIIFLIRNLSQVEMKYLPFFAAAAVMGQILGGKLNI